MIDIKDLRVGNCYLLSGHFYQLDEKGLENIFIFKHLERLSPIPLTPEILDATGLVKINENEHWINYEIFVLGYSESVRFNKKESYIEIDKHRFIDLYYVHQIQNLYHSLTFEELTMTLTHSLSH